MHIAAKINKIRFAAKHLRQINTQPSISGKQKKQHALTESSAF